ncbi:DUF1904 family protein [Cohnella sp. LGH]|uniref:DUF1904 family protein n=1 Tax=Cohnella sp. LGH TaxID=1619153 RepID=UPI001ADD2F5B|nr:DUF1904 family protein [Cohnella sp. LGH]QTH40334.1 DUF1904 family protein [Cohnella sp. LGH]
MPHLLFRGVNPEQVRAISETLVAELAAVCRCPEDYILLECVHTTALFEGKVVPSYPFVEVAWFDRGTAVRDLAAACIDRHIRSLGVPELEIAFRNYERESYYANGKSLREPAAESVERETESLLEENKRLKDELHKARKTLASKSAGMGSSMSSKLYDALRE